MESGNGPAMILSGTITSKSIFQRIHVMVRLPIAARPVLTEQFLESLSVRFYKYGCCKMGFPARPKCHAPESPQDAVALPNQLRTRASLPR